VSGYTAEKGSTALGIYYTFEGPGLNRCGHGVHFLQVSNDWAIECVRRSEKEGREHGDHESGVVVHLLTLAFQAGRKAAI
jgi:hypothetical protein